jgi:uncharacterized protein (TIGR02466 family)
VNTYSFFPTPVGRFNYEGELSESDLEFIVGCERKGNLGNTTSKDRLILDNPRFKNLKEFIQSSLDEYLDEVYKPDFDVKLRITQSWFNYTEPGQFHHKHSHPNSFLSAVFYISSDPSNDRIYFHNQQYKQIQLKPREWNMFNSESWWLPVGTNDLIVFPSGFTHSVEVKESTGTRISLALNTFPVGYVGDDDALTGLRL